MLKRFRQIINPKSKITNLSPITSQVDNSPGWGSITSRNRPWVDPRLRPRPPPGNLPGRPRGLAQEPHRLAHASPSPPTTSSATRSPSPAPTAPSTASSRPSGTTPRTACDLRLEAMCDELARAGDLFVLLFRNPQDGMCYIRFVTKDRICAIETAPNDWETELSYTETPETTGEPKTLAVPRPPRRRLARTPSCCTTPSTARSAPCWARAT